MVEGENNFKCILMLQNSHARGLFSYIAKSIDKNTIWLTLFTVKIETYNR